MASVGESGSVRGFPAMLLPPGERSPRRGMKGELGWVLPLCGAAAAWLRAFFSSTSALSACHCGPRHSKSDSGRRLNNTWAFSKCKILTCPQPKEVVHWHNRTNECPIPSNAYQKLVFAEGWNMKWKYMTLYVIFDGCVFCIVVWWYCLCLNKRRRALTSLRNEPMEVLSF